MLNTKDIEYGFNYNHDERVTYRAVVELNEYQQEKQLTINCTQLSENYPDKEKKRIVNEWIDFLSKNPEAFEELSFNTRLNQKLFDAICHQTNLKRLYIKWGVYPDISKISNLKKLEYLELGSGRGVLSVEPLKDLKELRALSIENFQKVSDYSVLKNLNNLESLMITGDLMNSVAMRVDSLSFLKLMTQLRYLNLIMVRVKDRDFENILKLENLEHLSLDAINEVKTIYGSLRKLPKLKYGLVIERPEIYEA